MEARPAPVGLAVGDVVAGRYRIDELLGAGGMGTVFRATQLGLQRAVALKVVRPEHAADPNYRARFEREARVMAALDHPSAVKVFDFGVETGFSWLVMELLIGEPLSAHLARAPLDEPTAAAIGATVCDVLVATHALRLVHRDLKPDNIFVVDGGDGRLSADRVRVVDFGIAFIEEAGDMGRLTKGNVVVGTPSYISPECAAGRAVGPAADLYALGVVLFEMVAGAPPFLGDAGEVVAKHIFLAPPTVASMRAAPVDTRFEEIVALLLKKNPDSRPTAEETRDRLLQIAGSQEHVVDHSRQARMVEAAAPPPRHLAGTDLFIAPTPTPLLMRAALRSDVELPENVRVALAAEGVMLADGAQPAQVVLLDGLAADLSERIAAARGRGSVVVAAVPQGDIGAVAMVVRLGVEDVVTIPLDPPGVARKVARALKSLTANAPA